MRKTFTTFCVVFALLIGLNAWGQTWNAPSLTFSEPVSGSPYYIYNVGAKGFLTRGGTWAMRAVVTQNPTAATSNTPISWTVLNTEGATWTFQFNGVANNFLFAADVNGETYTDNSTNNTWTVVQTDAVSKVYTIQIASTYTGGYNANQFLGANAVAENTNKGYANIVNYNVAEGDSYTKWQFVSQADLDLFLARVALDRNMNYAKLRGGIDLTSYISAYEAGITADIIAAAASLLAVLNPTDVSVAITNSSFENSFTGWTNDGFMTQNNNPGWTKDGDIYCEKWVSNGTNLPASTITQTIASGLANGYYCLSVTGHAIQQGGSNPFHTGVFLTAGGLSTEIIGFGNNYCVDFIEVKDGSLTLGYAISGTSFVNWTGFDNFKLHYYGAPDNTSVSEVSNSKAEVCFEDGKLVAQFNLVAASAVKISVYNIQGKLLKEVVEMGGSGYNKTSIDGDFASGVYVVKISGDNFLANTKTVK